MFLSVPKPNAAIIADVAAGSCDKSVDFAKPESLFGSLFWSMFVYLLGTLLLLYIYVYIYIYIYIL